MTGMRDGGFGFKSQHLGAHQQERCEMASYIRDSAARRAVIAQRLSCGDQQTPRPEFVGAPVGPSLRSLASSLSAALSSRLHRSPQCSALRRGSIAETLRIARRRFYGMWQSIVQRIRSTTVWRPLPHILLPQWSASYPDVSGTTEPLADKGLPSREMLPTGPAVEIFT